MSVIKDPKVRPYHVIPSKEIEKFFKKLSERAYSIHRAMTKHASAELRQAFVQDLRIRARGFFHLHPAFKESKWLLDHVEWSLPVFQFEPVKDYHSKGYFKDLVYFNGNLKNRFDTVFEAIGYGPTTIFDVIMTVKICKVEEGLFKEVKEVADVLMEKFNIIFEYQDQNKFNDLLRKKYKWNCLRGFFHPTNDHIVVSGRDGSSVKIPNRFITSTRWDVLKEEDRCADHNTAQDARRIPCCYPVDCWSTMMWTGNNRVSDQYPLPVFLYNSFWYSESGEGLHHEF